MAEFTEEQLEEIKGAAREGAKEGAKEIKIPRARGGWLGPVMSLLVIAAIVAAIIFSSQYFSRYTGLIAQLGVENDAEEHDLVLDNQGFLGYTVADFADAVLGDQSKLCKLEVMQQLVTDAVTLTNTGAGKWKVFTKTQLITYHGTALYTVDLSKLSQADFTLDEEKKEITVLIPHAELEPINIQSSDIEFGDVEKGMLAFGDISATPEQMAEVQTEAQNKMLEKLDEQNVIETADRFAKLIVWELFQPMVNSVTQGYSLKVEFK